VEVRQPLVGQYAGSSRVETDSVGEVGSAGIGVAVGSACDPPHPAANNKIAIANPIVFTKAITLPIGPLLQPTLPGWRPMLPQLAISRQRAWLFRSMCLGCLRDDHTTV